MSAAHKPRYMERYNRQKLIGSGAFGQAWLVQSKADGKQLVMKEIKIAKVKLFRIFFNLEFFCHRWVKKNVMMPEKKYFLIINFFSNKRIYFRLMFLLK
jgi:serine/threonine protein kinase